MEKLDIKKLFMLIEFFFGDKVEFHESTIDTIVFSLYDSFVFLVHIEERYKIFYAHLVLGHNIRVSKLLGERIATNNDEYSIIKSFELMDKYCRLRLSDKYLEVYDEICHDV